MSPPDGPDVGQVGERFGVETLSRLWEYETTLHTRRDLEALPGVLEVKFDRPGVVRLIVAPNAASIRDSIADRLPIGHYLGVVCPRDGAEWARDIRGATCWTPAVVMRNADGTLREPWFT